MNVLFLAYYFPPDSSSGSFRPLHFVNNLVEMEIGVQVLTARVEDFLKEQSVDHRLCEACHREVEISRCSVLRPLEVLIRWRSRLTGRSISSRAAAAVPKAAGFAPVQAPPGRLQQLKDLCTDLLATPDLHVGWLPDCLKQGKALISGRRPDVICATGSPWSGLVAGVLLKRATGVPVVLDFRDPWTSNPSFEFRNPVIRWIDVHLERFVVRSADGIIANTSTLRDDFLKKYPFLSPDRVITLTNGFEQYVPVVERPGDRPFTVAHTGDLYISRDPAPLLKAVKLLIQKRQIAPGEIRLQFVGGFETRDNEVAQLLGCEPLQDVVEVMPRVSYQESQHIAAAADVLLVVQPGFPLQVPRKIYEYMAMRKPTLCIAEPDSATGRLVLENRLGLVCNNTSCEIESALLDLMACWRKGALHSFADDRCDSFRNREITGELRSFLATVSGPGLAGGS